MKEAGQIDNNRARNRGDNGTMGQMLDKANKEGQHNTFVLNQSGLTGF